jgi:hypothetical protein
MTRSWVKKGTSDYAFLVDNTELGMMSVSYGTTETRAISKLGKVYPDKWYGSKWYLDYRSKTYNLRLRNNPMAEWALTDGETDILAYGLKSDVSGMTRVRISTSDKNQDFVLDYLLWYLFAPVAAEAESGDSPLSRLFIGL